MARKKENKTVEQQIEEMFDFATDTLDDRELCEGSLDTIFATLNDMGRENEGEDFTF